MILEEKKSICLQVVEKSSGSHGSGVASRPLGHFFSVAPVQRADAFTTCKLSRQAAAAGTAAREKRQEDA